MRLAILLLFLGMLNLAASSYSQQTRFSFDLSNATVKEVFAEIEESSNFKFLYRNELLDVNKEVTLTAQDETIETILAKLFDPNVITFRIFEDNLVVITNKNQQQHKVSGVVTDAVTGESLPGVNIVLLGTTSVGTITDLNGNYSIDVPSDNAQLVFSYVGYISQTMEVTGMSNLDVMLTPDIQALDEVVVIGYGTVRKSDLTGSVSSIKSEDMKKIAMVSLDQGIQGRAAGIQVTNSSSAPGGTVSVRIRGGNSLNSNNEPLYVVDGYPLTAGASAGGNGAGQNPLASLNPGDIESIEILKDASSTAIYGARGANGVVLITTKRGKSGKTLIEYNVYYGSQKVAKKLDMLNAREWAIMANEARSNESPSLAPLYPNGGTPSHLFPAIDQLGEGTDWQDEIFRTAPTVNHQLTVSGGNDVTRFSVSGNYFNQQGVVKNSDFKRGSFRAAIDTRIFNKITLSTSVSASHVWSNIGKSEGDGGTYAGPSIINNALVMPPTIPVRDPVTDEYVLSNVIPSGSVIGNPVAEVENALDRGDIDRMLGTLDLSYQIIDGLTLKVSFGTDLSIATRKSYEPKNTYAGFGANGLALQGNRQNISYLNENVLTYVRSIGNHSFNVVGGYTWQTNTNTSSSASASDFPTDLYKADFLNGGSKFTQPVSNKYKNQLASWLGRVNYIFKDRYLLTLTGRADGSSKFGKNNKWAFFPSAALAWRVTQEEFMKSIPTISNMKIRISYGLTGNQNIAEYQSIDRYSVQPYFFGGSLVSGLNASNIPNPDLKWETTAVTDVGLDLGFLRNRINFTADYYYKKTTDLLFNITVPLTTGFSTIFTNIGSLENKGLELSLSGDILASEFKWSTYINWSANRNKVLKIPGYVPTYQARVSGHIGINGSWLEEGMPIGVWNMLKYDGVYRNDAEFAASPKSKNDSFNHLGDPKFIDKSGDGFIVAGDDRMIVGDPNPDFIYSWTNNFSYKNFDLSIFLQGSQGNDILNVMRAETSVSSLWASQRAEVLDRWTPTNTNTDIPRARVNVSADLRNSSYLIEDGSYMRVKNITLGYNLPQIKYFRSARIYISGQNLITITNYSGFDPEVNSQGQSNTNLGVDYNSYPAARTFIIGLQVGIN